MIYKLHVYQASKWFVVDGSADNAIRQEHALQARRPSQRLSAHLHGLPYTIGLQQDTMTFMGIDIEHHPLTALYCSLVERKPKKR